MLASLGFKGLQGMSSLTSDLGLCRIFFFSLHHITSGINFIYYWADGLWLSLFKMCYSFILSVALQPSNE